MPGYEVLLGLLFGVTPGALADKQSGAVYVALIAAVASLLGTVAAIVIAVFNARANRKTARQVENDKADYQEKLETVRGNVSAQIELIKSRHANDLGWCPPSVVS